MDIDLNTRVTALIRPRKLDRRIAHTTTRATTDGNLITRNIKLRPAALASGMQRQRLGSQQVIAAGQVLGDGHVHASTAGVEVARAPVVVVAYAAAGFFGPGVGEDLEPATRGSVGCRGIGDFGEVDLHGTPVGAANGFGFAVAVVWLLVFGLKDVHGSDRCVRLGWKLNRAGVVLVGVLKGDFGREEEEGTEPRARRKGTYLVHLNRHGPACLDGAFPTDTPGTGIADEISASHVGDGGVGRRKAVAGGTVVGAVYPELLENCVAGYFPGSECGG